MTAESPVALEKRCDPQRTGDRDVIARGNQQRRVRDIEPSDGRRCRVKGEGSVTDSHAALEVEIGQWRAKWITQEGGRDERRLRGADRRVLAPSSRFERKDASRGGGYVDGDIAGRAGVLIDTRGIGGT